MKAFLLVLIGGLLVVAAALLAKCGCLDTIANFFGGLF